LFFPDYIYDFVDQFCFLHSEFFRIIEQESMAFLVYLVIAIFAYIILMIGLLNYLVYFRQYKNKLKAFILLIIVLTPILIVINFGIYKSFNFLAGFN